MRSDRTMHVVCAHGLSHVYLLGLNIMSCTVHIIQCIYIHYIPPHYICLPEVAEEH